MNSSVLNNHRSPAEDSEILRQSLVEATETIEYMVNALMWSADYKVLAKSKEKLWKLKQLLAHLDA